MPDPQAAVLALLPPAEREPYWLRTLQAGGKAQAQELEEVVQQTVAACPHGQTLSLALSQLLQDQLLAYLQRGHYVLGLAELCCVLHPDTLAPWLARAQQPDAPDGKTSVQALRHSLPVLKALEAMRQLPRASASTASAPI